MDHAVIRAAVIYKTLVKNDARVPRRRAAHEASPETFRQGYETSDIVVIGTHDLQSGALAREFSIQLRELLRMLDLVHLYSQAVLVAFEAYVSGVGKGFLGNDVLGFARSVLWLNEGPFSTHVVPLPRAYCGRGSYYSEYSSLSQCDFSRDWLRRAQIRLCHTDTPTAKAVPGDYRAACIALDPGRVSPGHMSKILNSMHDVITDEGGGEQSDYSHPFFGRHSIW
ncbi:hypothetical protein BKA56DRAFT_611196 [Ilyonectria sp. MPI-CAGE-AT-0026]|nr:hypothetical protein BKA56DRAFT_611196 [Ilyonectria sp. MPI-CAGE-AT-0026]